MKGTEDAARDPLQVAAATVENHLSLLRPITPFDYTWAPKF